MARQKGSHRQYKHATKTGIVAVAGKESDDLKKGRKQHSKASTIKISNFVLWKGFW